MTTDLKDIYRSILRCVLKDQIQLLVHQLSEHTGDETVVVTANVTERCHGNLGSSPGNKFLQQNTSIKEQFLNFCLGHHDGSSRLAHHPASQTSGKSSAQNAYKLKPDMGKTTMRNVPYLKKTNRRQLKPKPQSKPLEAKGHVVESKSKVGQIVNVSVNENDVMVEVNVSSNASHQGQGHQAEVRGHDEDTDAGLTEITGTPFIDDEDQLAVTMATNSSAVKRSSKRKTAAPFRRSQDPITQGATILPSSHSGATTVSSSHSKNTTVSYNYTLDTPMSSCDSMNPSQLYSDTRATTQSFSDTRGTTQSYSDTRATTQSYSDTRATTLFPSNLCATTLFPSNLSAKPLSSSYSSRTTLPAITFPTGYIEQSSSPLPLLGTIEIKQEPEEILDLSTTETRNVTQSPGYIRLNYIPCPALETIVPKVKPLDTTEMSTDDETRSYLSFGQIQRNSIRAASSLTTFESKVGPETTSSMLQGYREDLFPEQSPSSMSSPSRSQFTSTHSSPQDSLHPDVMLVSRGDGRYEKLIDCEICGKMCRTSNMARHRKRYCLLSTSREEILESDSPGVQGLFSEYEEKAWSLNGSKE